VRSEKVKEANLSELVKVLVTDQQKRAARQRVKDLFFSGKLSGNSMSEYFRYLLEKDLKRASQTAR
jgi:hypothetical protein